MICNTSCPDWRLRCILIACPDMSERLSRIEDDIDRQERIRGLAREMGGRIGGVSEGEGIVEYAEFLDRKSQLGSTDGFDPVWMPDFLFDFQVALLEWAILKGKAALYCDCGMGKTPMQLVWAENIVCKENARVLILTPLAVSAQTIREAEKFGIEAHRSGDGKL